MDKTVQASAALLLDYDVAMEVASHEAVVRQAYKDSVGKWTWSVGLTSATGHDVERYIGKPQSLEDCLRIYAWALDNYADDVRRAFRGVALTKAQFAAALSFHWNTGAIRSASWVEHFKAGRIAEAKKAFMNYRRPAEIIPRRRKVRDLFFNGKWSNDGKMMEWTVVKPSGYIDWSKGRKIDVSSELRAALSGVATAPVQPDAKPAPVQAPAPVVVEKPVVADPGELEQHPAKSKTVWSWLITTAIVPILTVFNDWRVQLVREGES